MVTVQCRLILDLSAQCNQSPLTLEFKSVMHLLTFHFHFYLIERRYNQFGVLYFYTVSNCFKEKDQKLVCIVTMKDNIMQICP